MNLPTLYRSASPHAARARSLIAEGTALSISVLADLCEEYSLGSDYWRSCSTLLSIMENVADCVLMHLHYYEIRKIHHTKRTISIPPIVLPYPEHAMIQLTFQINVKNIYLTLQIYTAGLYLFCKTYNPERLSFRDFGRSRLKTARRIVDFLLSLNMTFLPAPEPIEPVRLERRHRQTSLF